jgi:aryl-alcohol dehydrogenase (NADP+)
VEASLSRLDVDAIDLYQMHQLDEQTDPDETLDALSSLVDQGKILQLGHSNLLGNEITEFEWRARMRGTARFSSHQPPYNLMMRRAELDVLPACRRNGLGVLAYGCLNAGWLTGRYRRDRPFPEGSRSTEPGSAHRFDLANAGNARKFDVVEGLGAVAAQAGVSLTHMSLAWLLHRPDVTGIILGPRTREQLRDLLAVATIRLDADLLRAIDEVVAPGTDVNPFEANTGRGANPLISASLADTATST